VEPTTAAPQCERVETVFLLPGPSHPVIGHNVAFLRDSECLT